MGIFDSMFSAFGGTPAQQQPVQQQQTPGNIPPNSGAVDPANSTVPAGTVTQSQQQPPETSPLDAFADLWKPVEGQTPEQLFPNIDPAKLMEAAKKTDFAKVITDEQMEAIAGGGQNAVAAFTGAMNSVAQAVYANSALATTRIVEEALKKAQSTYDAKLPSLIKKQNLSDTLRAENPMFSNPAIQPIISALEAQAALKFPNASQSELTSFVKSYLEQVGPVFSPPKEDLTKSQKSTETDWTKFFS